MTSRIIAPPRPGVRGYQIVALPSDTAGGRADEGARRFSVLTVAGYTPLVPPGVDLLELGVVTSAGRYDLLPIDMDRQARWAETIPIWVPYSVAARQLLLLEQRYRALLEYLPSDAGEIDEWVIAARQRGEVHSVFGAVSRATIEVWKEYRDRGEPDDLQQHRLDQHVAQRAASLVHSPTRARWIDQESLRALVAEPAQCIWHCINACLADGDYEGATIRVIARLARDDGQRLPVVHVEPLLRSVGDLDIFFTLLRHTADVFDNLPFVLLRHSLCPSTTDADLVVRILYAAWMSLEVATATGLIRQYLPCIANMSISPFASSLAQWLAIQTGEQAASRIRSVDVLRSPEALQSIVELANRAFRRTLDDIVARLPMRVMPTEDPRHA